MAFGRGRFRPLFTKVDTNVYGVNLSAGQRDLISNLLTQLSDMLDTQSPALQRLFPEPYGDDDERNAGYAVLAGAELIENRHERIRAMQERIYSETIDGMDLDSWMRTVNDLRLVLGTVLDVDDEGTEPDDEWALEMFHIYEHLGFILEHMVEAMLEDGFDD